MGKPWDLQIHHEKIRPCKLSHQQLELLPLKTKSSTSRRSHIIYSRQQKHNKTKIRVKVIRTAPPQHTEPTRLCRLPAQRLISCYAIWLNSDQNIYYLKHVVVKPKSNFNTHQNRTEQPWRCQVHLTGGPWVNPLHPQIQNSMRKDFNESKEDWTPLSNTTGRWE